MSSPAAENLVDLALCEEAMLRLERERARIPQAIAEQEARLQSAREELEAQRVELERAEHDRRGKEAELQDTEAQRDKYQGQTALVKTNQEYTALLHEIERATDRISLLEDEILGAMERAEQIGTYLQTAETEHARVEREIAAEIGGLRERLSDVERELEVRRSEEQERVARLEPGERAIYARLKRKGGTATTRLAKRSCSACYRDVPYEQVNRVNAGEFQTCGYCQRILVAVPDDLGAGVPPRAEAAD